MGGFKIRILNFLNFFLEAMLADKISIQEYEKPICDHCNGTTVHKLCTCWLTIEHLTLVVPMYRIGWCLVACDMIFNIPLGN